MAGTLRPRQGETKAEFLKRVRLDPVTKADCEREAMLICGYAAECGIPAEVLAVAVAAASQTALRIVATATKPGEQRVKAFLAAAKLVAFSVENMLGE